MEPGNSATKFLAYSGSTGAGDSALDPVKSDIGIDHITELNDSLFALVPFIEEIEDHPSSEEETLDSKASEYTFTFQHYKEVISNNFPKISPDLAGTLAQVNWFRYQRFHNYPSERRLLLDDLEPYSCLHQGCPRQLETLLL
ncbi:hypothetical protein K440DRAFT_636939 [Wilcoxina mikolae CBS 423.85]|nr:hypothetical protein K440DRAFT_636939 [Wilcoxina mikolae CBS 423.85]